MVLRNLGLTLTFRLNGDGTGIAISGRSVDGGGHPERTIMHEANGNGNIHFPRFDGPSEKDYKPEKCLLFIVVVNRRPDLYQ